MKSIEFPIQLSSDSNANLATNDSSKKMLYFLLLFSSLIGGLFLPMIFIAFGMILLGGIILYCYDLYKEISSLDFGAENYSITLEDIIEDLEG